MTAQCWSWRHDGIAPLIEGGCHTCDEHRGEEDGINLVLKQLSHFGKQIADGLSGRGRIHLSRYEDVVEGSLKGFFQHLLPDYEVRRGNYQNVDNKDRQRDLVVVECVAVDRDLWRAEVTLPDEFSASALAVFEVAHAAAIRKWDGRGGLEEKLRIDLGRIEAVIDEGVRRGRKIFTGLALIGGGWGDHVEKIATLLHNHHHNREIVRVEVGDGDTRRSWWPFVDVVISPGCLFKKHDFFEQKTFGSARWPVLHQRWAGHADENPTLRPLSIARGYMRHFLSRARQSLDEEPAFEEGEVAAICGPVPDPSALPDSTFWKGKRIGIMVGHGFAHTLHHAGDQHGDRWRAVLIERDAQCAMGKDFIAVAPDIDASGCAHTSAGLAVPIDYLRTDLEVPRHVIMRTRDVR